MFPLRALLLHRLSFLTRTVLIVAKAGGDRPGIQVSHLDLEVYAHVIIPTGYKATGMKIAGTDTNNEVWAWEACCTGCPAIPLFETGMGGGYIKNVGTEYDFDGSANSPSIGADELISSNTNYLLIWVETEATSDTVYGGYVNIEKIF